MANLSHSGRKYSWWWDSHNSPKNSKWLQENITDIDAKVKSMIKLIEEDADSFARRAEMYYKKRPELMKLVEEFYRAYRALAERYNHATGELRYAHRTIAKAFPDQVPFELVEDSPSKEPHTPEIKGPACALFDADDFFGDDMEDSEGGLRKRGLKPLNDIFGSKNENSNLKGKIFKETERAGKAETEVQGLKKALADLQAEKEDVFLQYQRCLEKLSNIEGELENAQNYSSGLSEKATLVEIEVHTLQETLVQLETEKIAALVKQGQYLAKITDLEGMVSQVQEETSGCDKRAIEAENEAQILKEKIWRLELEKEEVIHQYKQCLGKISDLENIISVMDKKEKLLKNQAEKAEAEASELKKALSDLNKEKEVSAFWYNSCLEKISHLEKDLSRAKQDVKSFNDEILTGTAKLKTAEEKCNILEMSNRSLRVEADNLSKMIAMKDLEVSERQVELEKLETNLQNEHLHYAEIEATLQNLQSLHSQSQNDQKVLARELQDLLQILEESEVSKNDMEEEIRQVKDENETLNQSNRSSAAFMEDMQNEIMNLREIKEKLEKEVLNHIGSSNSLQQEILRLKEEIKDLNLSYRVLFEQVEDNSKLRQICDEGKNENEILSKKLEKMEELLKQKVVLENCLSNLSYELESSRETIKALQESCQFLREEKGTLTSEKASLLSQLKPITENMHKLLERNAVLENSLSTAKVELEGLREKSKGLENICELLKSERSYLLSEKDSLVLKLENVERKLESLEKRYMVLEANYADVAKEKETMHCQVKDLEVSLCVEKQERMNSRIQSETKFAGLENEVRFLKEEKLWKTKEFEEELEKALKAQFEISILQKFMKEMEEKNYSLIIECQKHVEASKLAEKLISELEGERLEQQVESELLLDEIERLRLGIYQVFHTLEESSPDFAPGEKVKNDGTFVDHILGIVEDMKFSISKHEDDKQLLLVENSVLLTLLKQLESKGMEIDAQKIYLEKEFKSMATNLDAVKNEKEKLLEMNRRLKFDVNEGHNRNSVLEAELGSYSVKQADLNKAYSALQEMYSQVNRDNKNLLKKFSDLKEEKFLVDQDNDVLIREFLAIDNQSAVLKDFSMEKIKEVKLLLEDLNRQEKVNGSLEKEMSILRKKLELQRAENLLLEDYVDKFKTEIRGIKESNVKKEAKILDTELKLKATENLKSKLCSTVDELKTDIQESTRMRENLEKDMLQLSENNSVQKMEIKDLHSVNSNLNSELGLLREVIEEKKIRENILNSELHEKNNEFELWEAEASTFYFDLQISSVREVLFENKVQELTEVCQNLENECVSKISEVEKMKGETCMMKSEVSGLKSQISAYAPVIASLKDDITFLEDIALLQTKLKITHNQEPEFFEVAARLSNSELLSEDETLLSLQNLQARVKTVGKLMEETNNSIFQRSKSKSKQESTMGEFEHSKPRRSFGKEKHEQSAKKGFTPKLQKIKIKATEIRNGMLMKDIPLDQVSDIPLRETRKKGNIGKDDQMLELWETAEDGQSQIIQESLRKSYKMTGRDIVYDQFENVKHKSDPPSTDSDVEKELGIVSSRPNREFNDKKILERLASDAQKLENLQITVQNLAMKLEENKKIKKVAKNVDFETVNEQLLEADETVVHLVEMNGQLLHDIQKCPSADEMATMQLKETVKTRRRKVVEQARKGSERIGRLQLELQKIQYILLKMEDDKRNKVKNKFFRNKTIILRDFIYNKKKNSGKRKKGPFCGCFRPPSTGGSGRNSSSNL